MSFQIYDLFGGAPTASTDQINPGQPFGSSYLPGAPSISSVSLNSGITFSPNGSGGGFSNVNPNNLAPPADVRFASNPINTAGLFGSVATGGTPYDTSGSSAGHPAPNLPVSNTSTTNASTTTSTTDDAINRLIDLAAAQNAGGGGGGGIVALPTGIASSSGSGGGGLGLGAIALIIGVIAIGAYVWHKHNKKKGGEHASA